MPKTYLIHIDHNYPFDLVNNNKFGDNTLIKIIRAIPLNEVHMDKELSAKILFAHSLRNKNLIRVQYVQEKSANMQICYEFIQAGQICKNSQFWQALMPQLETFLLYLINIGVKIKLDSRKIGVNCQGILKYYLGLQFQLSEDNQETYLQHHYEKQIKQFKKNNIQPNEQLLKLIPLDEQSYIEKQLKQKYRKASFITLPSKIPNLLSLNKQLNRIKTSVKQISQCQHRTAFQSKQIQKYQYQVQQVQKNYYSNRRVQYKALSPSENISPSPKKQLVRKYSGDSKGYMCSNRKLSAKFSDFRSDRRRQVQAIQTNHQRVDSPRGKSRMQQMKYQEYIQITKSHKNYLNDFLSVLEDDFGSKQNQNKAHCHSQQTMIGSTASGLEDNFLQQNNKLCVHMDTAMLKRKAEQSIKNSLKVIKRVRGTC